MRTATILAAGAVAASNGYWRRDTGQRSCGRVVTVRVEGMTFLRPVAVGDVVCCYALR